MLVDALLFASRSHALSTAEATVDGWAVRQCFAPPASLVGVMFASRSHRPFASLTTLAALTPGLGDCEGWEAFV